MTRFNLLILVFTLLFSCTEKKCETIPFDAATKNQLLQGWGLGNKLIEEYSNDIHSDWYIDQLKTGRYYAENCGPTVATMALKWSDTNLTITVKEARSTYVSKGGCWWTSDITAYLDNHHVYNYISSLKDTEQSLVKELKAGNIAILCVDMSYIHFIRQKNKHVGKFYKTGNKGWGHFIIVKGYKKVDEKLYFEIYDPYSMGKKYSNNELKGKNRYYNSADIKQATNHWWNYAIIVSRRSNNISDTLNKLEVEHRAALN